MKDFFATNKPRILIIEDEPLVADGLKKQLLEFFPVAEFYPVLGSVKKALSWFEKSEVPDLIFSDIQLSDGISFDIFKNYETPCPVIFTTAYDRFALRAFEVNSVDYLLKPISRADLKTALDRLKKRRASFQLPDLRSTLEESRRGGSFLERFLVHFQNSLYPIYQHEVALFQKEQLIFVIRKDGRRFLTDFSSMDELESKLNPALFFRANRQVVIRLDEVQQIRSTHKGLLLQTKSPDLPPVEISRERGPAFKKWLLGV